MGRWFSAAFRRCPNDPGLNDLTMRRINIGTGSGGIGRQGRPIRDVQPDAVPRSGSQTFARHRLDHRPVLPEEPGRIVDIRGLHLDAASPSSPTARNLEIESIAGGFPVVPNRLIIAAHSVSPLYCVDLAQFRLANWPFVRRDCGALEFDMRVVAPRRIGCRALRECWPATTRPADGGAPANALCKGVGRILSAPARPPHTKGEPMKKGTSKRLTPEQRAELKSLAALPDDAIDTSDAP